MPNADEDVARIDGLSIEWWEAAIDRHLAGLGVTLFGQARLVTEGTGREDTSKALAKLLFDVAAGVDPKQAVQAESIRLRDELAAAAL